MIARTACTRNTANTAVTMAHFLESNFFCFVVSPYLFLCFFLSSTYFLNSKKKKHF